MEGGTGADAGNVRGWAPLIALQIEYSLLERTVEDELTPMARELDLALCLVAASQWLLSGKYTRANAGAPPSGGEPLRHRDR